MFYTFEMANNHMGSVSHAKKIIDEFGKLVRKHNLSAAMKLQFRQLKTFIHKDYQDSDLKYVKRFKETELTQEQFQEIVDYIKANGMKAMSTPFDNDSLVWMDELDIDVVKIASCSIDDWPLLEEVCKINKKIIISTAGADFDLLKKVYRLFKKNKRDFAFMHCVGEYPTPIENSNLNRIKLLQQEFPGYEPTTVTYSEDVKGWVSFKSFGGVNINGEELTLDYGVSLAKKYFTMHQGRLYEHHMQGAPRNTFYGIFVPSTLTAVLNESPSIVKIFNTLNYEGSQSKVKLFETKTTDADINETQETLSNINIHNSTQAKDGWAVDTSLGGYIKTDKQQGTLIEFIEKEGKWFNYIRGDGSDVKTADLSFQGLGIVTNTPTIGS